MPGKCTICVHPQRAAAENSIANGASVRSVATRLKLSYSSLDRHTRNCVPHALKASHQHDVTVLPPETTREVAAQATERRDLAFADALMSEVDMLHRTTMELLHESRHGRWLEIPDPSAEDPNRTRKVYDVPNVKHSIRAIAEARKNLQLIARLSGQLEPKETERDRTVTWEEFEAIYIRHRREVKT